jgi:hypothetical protein
MSTHRSTVRIFDAALVTAYQRDQRNRARRARIVSWVMLALMIIVVALLVAMTLAWASPAHAQDIVPTLAPAITPEVGNPPCPEGGMCYDVRMPIVAR